MTRKINVELMFIEEVLGTLPANQHIHDDFIVGKLRDEVAKARKKYELTGDDSDLMYTVADGGDPHPITDDDLKSIGRQEGEAIPMDELAEKATTIFPLDEQGRPFIWDYQVKGFFKESCQMLKRAGGDFKSGSLKAYKKEIDGLVFPRPRKIVLQIPEGGSIGSCQRPLRAQTAQGERVALASSKTVPAGTVMQFSVLTLKDSLVPLICEWMEYGAAHGMGQWRNSGKGSFVFRATDAFTGKRVAGTWEG